MLNLTSKNSQAQTTWKVLIYDAYCRDLLSPILHMKDLKREGVTLHLYALISAIT